MLFFDTNVIIYSIVNQDAEKLKISQQLIETAFEDDAIIISPLVLNEMIFTLGKLGIDSSIIEEHVSLWSHFSINNIDSDMVNAAFGLCKTIRNFKTISDGIHLKFAEKYCSKLVTFDNHFKKFIPYTYLDIELL